MSQLPQTATMSRDELYQFFWNTKYVPEIAAKLAAEAEKQTDAFFDEATITVCGEELRMMTPRDLVYLDGFDNAFVCARDPQWEDLEDFVWRLNAKNSGKRTVGNAWRRGRCMGRLDARPYDFDADCAEVLRYMDKIVIEDDQPKDDEAKKRAAESVKPPTTHFLVPLLVEVCESLGAIDPFSGKLIADVPIPRLTQYAKKLRPRDGERRNDFGSFDSMRSRCLDDVNQAMVSRGTKAE